MENKAFGEDVNEGNALSGGRRIKFEDTESNGSSKRMPENVYREVDASSSGTENNSSPSKRPDWFKSQSTKERLYGLSPTAGGQNRDEDGANVWGPESELPCRLPGCKPLHVIHPSGLFRSRWNIIAVVFILYTSIELPMSLAFSTCNSINSASFWIGVIVDLFFIADLLINTITGFTDDGEIILSYALAWRHYVKSPGFFIDLVSTIPLDYLSLMQEGVTARRCVSTIKATRLVRTLRIFRLARLFRLRRLFRYSKNLTESYSKGIMRIMKLVFLLALFVHWNACLLFMVSNLTKSPKSWVQKLGIQDAPASIQYSWSLFTSVSQMLCIGYGPLTPEIAGEVWITIWSMLSGAALFSGIVGSVTALLLSLDSSGTKFTAFMDTVEAYMSQREVPSDLRDRIRTHLRLKYSGEYHVTAGSMTTKSERPRISSPRLFSNSSAKGSNDGEGDETEEAYSLELTSSVPRMFNEDKLLSELPTFLKKHLKAHSARELLGKIPLLCRLDMPAGLATSLAALLTRQYCLKGDILISQGEAPEEMYFIESGAVELTRLSSFAISSPLASPSRERSVANLVDGSYFGEFPFLFPSAVRLQPFTAKVMMNTIHDEPNHDLNVPNQQEAGAVLHSISGKDLARVFCWFPEIKEVMMLVARQRVSGQHLESEIPLDDKSEAYVAMEVKAKTLGVRRHSAISELFEERSDARAE